MDDEEMRIRFVRDVAAEYNGAMAKFPSNRCNVAALMEEVGELAQALLQYEFEPAKYGVTSANIYAEAVQVAAMAMKIALHGSSEFPSYQFSKAFAPFKPTGSS
jgi:hypothetical protein